MEIFPRRSLLARSPSWFARLVILLSFFALSGCPLSAVTPKMVPISNEFFDMPWPNATRKRHSTGHFLSGLHETRSGFMHYALGYTDTVSIPAADGVYPYDGCDEP